MNWEVVGFGSGRVADGHLGADNVQILPADRNWAGREAQSRAKLGSMFAPRLDTLPPPQRRLWDEMSSLPLVFTLYGGTAIALHLGHRASVDFDFFCSAGFDPRVLTTELPFLRGAQVTQVEPQTLSVIVDRGGPVKLSFFGLPGFPRLAPRLVAPNNVHVASLLDLAGTKASVVQVRAEAKDYLDIDALIGAGLDLPHALAAGRALYGAGFTPQATLKALSYFEDGDLRTLPEGTRKRLSDAVRAVNIDALPILEPTP
jgi:Nucleotidyl transferase AbiEii toxin, Type IV TA system